MEPGTVVLLHSPLVGVESWGAVPEALRRGGAAVLAAPVDDDDRPPYAGRYVAQAAARVLEAAPAPASPLVLAGHSGAGPLLPAVGAALPAGFRVELEAGGRFPGWNDRDLAPIVPDPAARAALLASLRPRALDFFTEPLPGDQPSWPDAPCGYLHLAGPGRGARLADRAPARRPLPRAGRPGWAGRRDAGAAGEDLTSSLPWRDRDSHGLGDSPQRGWFAVHRPGRPLASPRSNGLSGRRDVTRRVVVGVAGPCAGDTAVGRLALAALRCDVPARRAALAGVGGGNLVDPAGRLVLQPVDQPSPPACEDGAVQPGLLPDAAAGPLDGALGRAGHGQHVQILDTDQVEPAGQVGADLLGPVPAAVSLPGLEAGDSQLGPIPAVRPLALAGLAAFQQPQPAPLGRAQPGGLEQFPGRQRRRHRNTPVDPDHLAIAGREDGGRDRREGDMPAAGAVPGDPVGPRLRHGAGPAEPDPAELGDQHLAPAAVQPPHVGRPDRDDTESLVHVAFAPRRRGRRRWPLLRRPVGAAGAPLPERREPGGVGGVEVPQRLLLDDHAARRQPRIGGSGLGELPALLGEPRCRAARLPPRPLLHRQVPHVPGVRAVAQQHVLLRGGGVQPEAAHPRNLASTCDNEERERRSAPA